MAEPQTADVGAALREARLKRGVSLKQIAAKTRISLGALEALERNDIFRLPGGIFTRAFIRSYASEVGLDPEHMVREFLASFPHEAVTAGMPHSGEAEENEAIESSRRAAQTVVKLIAVSAPIALAVIYFGLTGRSRVPPLRPTELPVVLQTKSVPPAESAPARYEIRETVSRVEASDGERPTAPGDEEAALTVTIRPIEVCWLSAKVDGERAFSRLVQAGEETVLRAGEEIVLTVGDAGALELIINGAAARALGSRGQVVTVKITAENYRNYLAMNTGGQE